MLRYTVRPRSILVDDADHGLAATAGEIIAAESDWIATGLLDERGEPLWRERGRIRLGFTALK